MVWPLASGNDIISSLPPMCLEAHPRTVAWKGSGSASWDTSLCVWAAPWNVHGAGKLLGLSGSSEPVIYPVGGPDAGQWSVELFCLPGGLYHRDYSSVHLQVRVLAPSPPQTLSRSQLCAPLLLFGVPDSLTSCGPLRPLHVSRKHPHP